MSRIGRPPSCTCGTCRKCKHAAYMREWWARQSAERKRTIIDARKPQTPRPGRKKKPRSSEKRRALWTVHNAIRDGRLHRQSCEVCGDEKSQAHHDDYDKPLEVRWLCQKHHGEVHRKYVAEVA